MNPSHVSAIMGIENRFIMIPDNSVADTVQSCISIMLAWHVTCHILIPLLHCLLNLCHLWQENTLSIIHHILTLMAINILALQLLLPSLAHHLHPLVGSGY